MKIDVQKNPEVAAKTIKEGKSWSKAATAVGVLLLIAALAFAVWAERERREVEKKLSSTNQRFEELMKNPQAVGEQVNKDVLAKVQKHFFLSDTSKAAVATITDVDAMKKENHFFDSAENGDNLIITETRAILYSPKKDVVVDVVPVSPQTQDASATPAPSASPASKDKT